ncbi:hypothetical protein L7H84_38535, partial [Klebsiella pneumoniae]|nr:hypothetical protein [Klebsiella pneumoniae]
IATSAILARIWVRKNRHKRFFPACGALRLSRAMVHRFRRFGSPEKAHQAPSPEAAGNVFRGSRLIP